MKTPVDKIFAVIQDFARGKSPIASNQSFLEELNFLKRSLAYIKNDWSACFLIFSFTFIFLE